MSEQKKENINFILINWNDLFFNRATIMLAVLPDSKNTHLLSSNVGNQCAQDYARLINSVASWPMRVLYFCSTQFMSSPL